MASLYPVFLRLQGQKCVVVGAGRVALRKVQGLLDAQAQVVVVGPDAVDEVQALHAAGEIDLYVREFEASDLDGAWLAIAATDQPEVNRSVGKTARKLGVLFCDAGGQSGDFIVPALLQQGELLVAVSTGGASPFYSAFVRDLLGEAIGPEHAEFLDLLRKLRPKVKAAFPHSEAKRRAVWQKIVNKEMLALVQAHDWTRVEKRISECLLLSQV